MTLISIVNVHANRNKLYTTDLIKNGTLSCPQIIEHNFLTLFKDNILETRNKGQGIHDFKLNNKLDY